MSFSRLREADSGHCEEIVVHRFKLVRERVYTGNGKGEIRVVLVSEAQSKRLDSNAEADRVSVERLFFGRGFHLCQLLGAKDQFVNLIAV